MAAIHVDHRLIRYQFQNMELCSVSTSYTYAYIHMNMSMVLFYFALALPCHSRRPDLLSYGYFPGCKELELELDI